MTATKVSGGPGEATADASADVREWRELLARHADLTCALEDTVPTAHAKIRSVIDRRLVSRPEMEAIVRSLFLVSRCADRARVSEALRAAAQGEPLPLPAAADGRRPAGALLGVALEPVHDPLRAPERGAWAS